MPPATRRSTRRVRDYSKPLTPEKIAAAAIDIVRQDGQAALSMRRVAGLFGVDVAALYRHFENKDALLAEVGRMASEIVELEAPSVGSWEERFVALATAIRARIAEHPELGIYGGGSPWATPFIARANGLIAAHFCEAGLSGKELVFATQAVLHLITSVAQSEVMTRGTSKAMNRTFAESIYDQLPEEVRKAWPTTRSEHAWSLDFDEFFEFVLRSTLDAVAPESLRSR
jgi:AcrR family transcriptional regulator